MVLHQAVPPEAPFDEQDVLVAAAAVARGLAAAGWRVTRLAMTPDLAASEAGLRAAAPDLVFNLVESLGGADVLAVAVPALLERLGLRYTGADLAALALTADKRAMRRLLRAAGITVPAAPEDGLAGPFIVKSAIAHASAGLGPDSVHAAPPAALAPGWYAEAYIDGREFNISLLADGTGGVAALPAAELEFLDWPADLPRIQDYAAKWDQADPRYQRTRRSFAVAPDLARRLQALALACWQALGLAGYARVDLRLAADGVAYVIDVNPNPCLSEDAGFAAAAAEAGLDHAAVVARIAEAALPRPSPSHACGVGPSLSQRERESQTLSLWEREGPIAQQWEGEGRPARFRAHLRPGDDIAALCRATGFFSAAEIAVAEELADAHRAQGVASGYHFLLADAPAGLAGYACYGPTPGTMEAWDLYWIAVHPRAQGGGLGRALVTAVLAEVAAAGGRRLYAETAGKALYAPTRAFYAAAGFTLQAVVPDFYAPGDAKQIWLRRAP